MRHCRGQPSVVQLCVSLRQGGWKGAITVIGDEEALPYHRPPLSKDFFAGNKNLLDILIRPGDSYETANIDLKLGVRVGVINRDEKSVLTDDGDNFSYDKLVLATGARVRHLRIPGADYKDVYYFRDTKDVLAIKSKVAPGKCAVIIGGGYAACFTTRDSARAVSFL